MPYTSDLCIENQTATGAKHATLFVSLELSRSKWLVTSLSPGNDKMSKHAVAGGDGNALLALLRRLTAKAAFRASTPKVEAPPMEDWRMPMVPLSCASSPGSARRWTPSSRSNPLGWSGASSGWATCWG